MAGHGALNSGMVVRIHLLEPIKELDMKKLNKKRMRELYTIVSHGVTAVHDWENHKREPRPPVKGILDWLRQPIHMPIVPDPEHCKGCRALEASIKIRNALK